MSAPAVEADFRRACRIEDILPGAGVCALLAGRQVALFRVTAGSDAAGTSDQIFALGNHDPASGANVLSRGLVGDLKGELVVASPVYKHHYGLRTGRCLEDETLSVPTWPVRLNDGQVWVQVPEVAPPLPRRRLVVVGNGMAAMRVVEELVQMAPEVYDITVFGAEPHGNYNRIMLSPLLAGEKQREELFLHTPEWYRKHGVTLHMGDPVTGIDRRRRTVSSQSGRSVSYDRLLLATGSTAVVLPVPGCDLPGVVTFRDLKDVDTMLEAARTHRRAAVIGGGLLGLEAANGLARQGMDVTVVHLSEWLMERQLDEAAASLLKASLESRGLKFLLATRTAAVTGTERATGLKFADGTELPADLVVMTAGVRPNITLAKQVGLRCERGILVTDTLQTWDPHIYAVGECVQHRNQTFGLVAPLWEQARVCAAHLAGFGARTYRSSISATQLKVTGIDLYSAGDFQGEEGTETLVLRDPARGVYKRLVLQGDKVRGAVLYGDTRDGAWYFDLIRKGSSVRGLRDQLLFGPPQEEPDGVGS